MTLPSFTIASSILLLASASAFAQAPKFGPGPHPGVTPGHPARPAPAASAPADAASAPAQPASAASAAK